MRSLIESLERRQLLSDTYATVTSSASGSENHVTVTRADGTVDTFDYDVKTLTQAEAEQHSMLVIRYADDGQDRSMMTFSPLDGVARAGVFTLPTIRADGSARVTGSEGDDDITIEATTGFAETKDDKGAPSDGEHDFLNVIDPTTGERYIASGFEMTSIDGMLTMEAGALRGETDRLADIKAAATYDNREEAIAESEARIAAIEEQIARYEALKPVIESGRFVHYTLAGVYDYYVQIADDQPTTARVTVDAGAGNDAVTISPNVPMKSTLYGGSGADVLTTGKKTTSVFAGGGKDRLINRSTKGATLDGGQGADRYFNRTAGDVNVIGRDDGDRMIFASGYVSLARTVLIAGTPNASGYYALSVFAADSGDGSPAQFIFTDSVRPITA